MQTQKLSSSFTGYQKFVVAVLAFLQFTIILDFMILSPLGAFLMPALNISTAQFGYVVSAYAFSAGISGILAAGFADRYDRKKFLLFFYIGFLIGTLCCALAPTYHFLLAARMVTGIFGGVVGSVVFAITTDLFPFEMRGRVMGILQTAFAASQILGLPAGLFFANHWGWHSAFFMIVIVGVIVGLVIQLKMRPLREHLNYKTDRKALHHLLHTLTDRNFLLPFSLTALLSTGGYLLMPFGSAFTVNNLKIHFDHLPMIYLITGIAAIAIGPLVGRMADKFGKFRVFSFGTVISMVVIVYYTHLGPTALWYVIAVNVLMFVGIFSRMIPSQALMSAIPSPQNRGAFMAVSSSLQQIAGGFASILAGAIVNKLPNDELEHYDILGYVLVGTMLACLIMMYRIHLRIPEPNNANKPEAM